jgi:hypothetical protein
MATPPKPKYTRDALAASETEDPFAKLKGSQAPATEEPATATAKVNPSNIGFNKTGERGYTLGQKVSRFFAPLMGADADTVSGPPKGVEYVNDPYQNLRYTPAETGGFQPKLQQEEAPAPIEPEAPVVSPPNVPDPTTDGTFGMGGGAETTTMQPPGGNLVTAANTLGAPEATPLVGDLIDTFQPGKDDPFAWLAMFQQGKQMSTDLANRSQRKFNNLVKARKTEADTVTGDFQRAVLSDVFKHGGQVTKRFDAIGNLVFPNLLSQKTAATSAQTAALKAQQDAMGITSTPVSEGMPGEPGQVVWNVKGAEAAPLTMNTDEQVKILPIMQELQQSGLSPYQAAVEALMTIRGQR